MSKNHLLLIASVFLVTVSCSSSVPSEEAKPAPSTPGIKTQEPVDLFDGHTLNGWKAFLVEPDTMKEDVWSVRDGLLVCKGEPLGFIYTDKDYESFELLVEWRWAPGKEPGNSGVLMRINGDLMGIPRAYEAQLQSGNAGDLYGFHGFRMEGPEERTRRQKGHELLGDFVGISKIEAAENEPGSWNMYRIRFDGPNLTVHVNGKKVNEAHGCDQMAGPIGFQSEGGEIHFRKIQLTPIG